LADACMDMVRLGPAMLFSGVTPRDSYTLVSVLSCPQPGHSFNFGVRHGHGYLALFPPGAPLDAFTPEGYVNASLSVPIADFHACLAVHFPDIPDGLLARGAGMRVGEKEHGELSAMAELLWQSAWDDNQPLSTARSRHEAGSSLTAAFFAALRSGSENLVQAPEARIALRQRRIRQARDFFSDRIHEPVFLDDLCSEIGLSRRAVENLFQDFLGMTPANYLKRQRLHGVRRTLQNKPGTPGVVKETALHWGFWHMGHFTHDYQELFGERPSLTLRR
jgi:AraC family ethanolamine operon transcriptional activator